MGCGCSAKTYSKEKEINNKIYEDSSKFKDENLKESVFSKIMYQSLKLVAFFIMLLFVPFIMIAVVWFIFSVVVLNKEVDMKKIVTILASKIKRFNEDEYDDDDYEDDDFEEYDEDNYELIDVEEVK